MRSVQLDPVETELVCRHRRLDISLADPVDIGLAHRPAVWRARLHQTGRADRRDLLVGTASIDFFKIGLRREADMPKLGYDPATGCVDPCDDLGPSGQRIGLVEIGDHRIILGGVF